MDKQTLEMILVGSGGVALGIGMGLQLATYFYKYGKPAMHLVRAGAFYIKKEEGHISARLEVKKAGLSHAKGYVPSVAAKICMATGVAVLANTFVYDRVKSKICSDYPTIATCFKEKSYKPLYHMIFNAPSPKVSDKPTATK